MKVNFDTDIAWAMSTISDKINEKESKIIASVNAPVLLIYTKWILDDAQKHGIKRLYFLARDGYVLHYIATEICKAENIDIECKYLYCSRKSLREASYRILKEKELFKLLTIGCIKFSPRVILDRVNATADERKAIYNRIGIDIKSENNAMPIQEIAKFQKKLFNCDIFKELILKNSEENYKNCIGYLKQEGLLDNVKYAIVDTGWTGSVQRTMRQLLNSAGKYDKLIGYYFGLFIKPQQDDGIYKTYYFNAESSKLKIAKFNNNLFECMTISPHAMTTGYEKIGDTYYPIYEDYNINYDLFLNHYNVIIEFIKSAVKTKNYKKYSDFELRNYVEKALIKMMYKPTYKMANIYRRVKFCDDVSECYMNRLIEPIPKDKARHLLICNRLKNKIFKLKENHIPQYFWIYGSLAISDLKCKSWYRFNVFLWDILRQYWINRKN